MKAFHALLLASVLLTGGGHRSVAAEGPSFEASVDRAAIGQDESVALRFKVVTSGMSGGAEPEFEAPDFDVVNQYSSVFVESFYENGKFGARNNRQFTGSVSSLLTSDRKSTRLNSSHT